ncbi:MAG: hypothetical protein M3540_07085 [Actinomycetota bacterium]|nr:hypothetical protein [Actinomycetota bacterium]
MSKTITRSQLLEAIAVLGIDPEATAAIVIRPDYIQVEGRPALFGTPAIPTRTIKVVDAPCGATVNRCFEAGQHQPVCRCALPVGHTGPHSEAVQ